MYNNANKSDYTKRESSTHSVKRRKSESNLLSQTQDTQPTRPVYAKRNSQMSVTKSISITMAERQLTRLKKDDAPQEDTFYRALEIKFHHSVGSMSISPACRDVVLAG